MSLKTPVWYLIVTKYSFIWPSQNLDQKVEQKGICPFCRGENWDVEQFQVLCLRPHSSLLGYILACQMVGKRSTLNLPWNSSESVLFNYIPIGKQTKPVSLTQWFEVNTSRQTCSEFCLSTWWPSVRSFQPAGRGTQLTRTEGLCPESLNVSVLRQTQSLGSANQQIHCWDRLVQPEISEKAETLFFPFKSFPFIFFLASWLLKFNC